MIIGAESRIHPVGSFVQGLQKAARGVLLVRQQLKDTPQALTTGWMITDSLLIVPSYALTSPFLYSCHPPEEPSEIALELVGAPGIGSPRDRAHLPAVLRLAEPLAGRALQLAQTSPAAKESMFILHYAGGRDELQISSGSFLEATAKVLDYNADTEGGSGGGPIFSNRNWQVVGMHMFGQQQTRHNSGTPIAAILETLRGTNVWPEIANYHRLVDVAAALSALETQTGAEQTVSTAGSDPAKAAKLKAAVHWTFQPEAVGFRDELKPLVVNPAASEWTLKTNERQRILEGGHTLDELRAARGDTVSSEPREKVIDRILKGPPYILSQIEDSDLPYWLQAGRWFAKTIPNLPSTANVHQEMARRRIRSGLLEITEGGIRGRDEELAKLENWLQDTSAGPMVVSGIGGVGKSTLVAQFALNQPENIPLLWLDFDRADLAPDDAVSVLEKISEQMAVQVAGFTKLEINEQNWETQAHALGIALESASSKSPALLVLDGFEVAQHAQRHSEIWLVLDSILEQAPHLRVIVSGRAPVKDLKLRGKTAMSIHLAGIPEADARDWLEEKGMTDPVMRDLVAKRSRGVPLLLRLALRLFEKGGTMRDLPAKLPDAFIEGFLYQRILDRVMDPELKPLACDALVLRIVNQNILDRVLHDRLPTGAESTDVFKRLAQEMGLVDPGGLTSQPIVVNIGDERRLQLRPEVRSATLKLLETDNPDRVREIDRRALTWYESQNLDEPANAAELVYHALRLGKINQAEAAWRGDCVSLLEFAADDLDESATAERAWLKDKLAGASNDLARWEAEAVQRVQMHIGRGLERTIPEILRERTERSEQSPLVFYDAWVRWRNKDLQGARQILDAAGPGEGVIQRDRTLLRAAVTAADGDPETAGSILEQIQSESQWGDPLCGDLEALAVLAARVRLMMNFEGELELLLPLAGIGQQDGESFERHRQLIARNLRPSDLVLSEFFNLLNGTGNLETLASIEIPSTSGELEAFQLQLDQFRKREGQETGIQWFVPLHEAPELMSTLPLEGPKDEANQIGRMRGLAILSWRRWQLATTTVFLKRAAELIENGPTNSFTLSIIASLLPFRTIKLASGSHADLDQLLALAAEKFSSVPTLRPGPDNIAFVRKTLRGFKQAIPPETAEVVQSILEAISQNRGREYPWIGTVFKMLNTSPRPCAQTSMLLFALSPNPLQQLCQRVASPPLE